MLFAGYVVRRCLLRAEYPRSVACTSMQISIFVIDLTSKLSHQPKRIIMSVAEIMMSLSFKPPCHRTNFDPEEEFANDIIVKSLIKR